MLLSRVAGVAAMCVCVGVAMGAAVKFKSMEPVGPGVSSNPDVDGMATYRYNADTTFSSLQVIAHDLEPGTTYSVYLESDIVSQPFLDVFTTNPAGNGQCLIESLNVGDLTEFNPKITIFLWNGNFDHIFEPEITNEGLIRAVATNN